MGSTLNFIHDEYYDGVSQKENLRLYDVYTEKAMKTIYQKRMNMPKKVLKEGRIQFEKLGVTDQAETLLYIQMLFNRNGGGGCDLSMIGGAKKAAVTTLSTCISNWTKVYSTVCIIDRSVSGLWERRSGNLLDLL